MRQSDDTSSGGASRDRAMRGGPSESRLSKGERDPETAWTPNQLVATNVRRLRRARGWTQAEFGLRVEPYLGRSLCQVAVSALERSAAGERRRIFSADDLVALAQTFDVPVLCLFVPPPGATISVGGPGAPVLSSSGLLGTVLGSSDNEGEWDSLIAEWDQGETEARRAVANLADPTRPTEAILAKEVAVACVHRLIRRLFRCDLVDVARTVEQLAQLVVTVQDLDERRDEPDAKPARSVVDDSLTLEAAGNGTRRDGP